MKDGIFDKYDMIEAVQKLLDSISVTGQKSVVALSSAFQIVSALQKGLKAEEESKNKIIETLKEQLKQATEPHPPEDGGDVIGGEHYDLKFGGVDSD